MDLRVYPHINEATPVYPPQSPHINGGKLVSR